MHSKKLKEKGAQEYSQRSKRVRKSLSKVWKNRTIKKLL